MNPVRLWRSWGRGRRRGVVVVVLAGAALLGVAAFSARDAAVYYRTPSEVVAEGAAGETVRVGGLVVAGSLESSDDGSSLTLTDGAQDIRVSYPGPLPAVVREGQGAVVEGRWSPTGVLLATQLLMRHSNEYRAPEDAP